MTSLYNCRHSGDQYRISKFDLHFDLESSYLCTEAECECPAGHRPTCRHRQMLPKFIQRSHIGDEWFFDFDRGGWVQGPSQPAASDESEGSFLTEEELAPAGLGSDLAPQAPTTPAPQPSPSVMEMLEASVASEASALGVPEETYVVGPVTYAPMPPLPAGVTIIGLDDPALLHNAIADAVGEPSAKITPTPTIRRRI